MIIQYLAHGGMNSPAEEIATGVMLVLTGVSTVGGAVVGGLTRHGRKPLGSAPPQRESLQGAWTGGSWER